MWISLKKKNFYPARLNSSAKNILEIGNSQGSGLTSLPKKKKKKRIPGTKWRDRRWQKLATKKCLIHQNNFEAMET